MPQDPVIEVEVVEIDGRTPVLPQPAREDTPPSRDRGWQDWSAWQGKVRRLDARWWPLWALLGILALAFLLTIGIAFAVVFVIARTIRHILLTTASLFSASPGGLVRK